MESKIRNNFGGRFYSFHHLNSYATLYHYKPKKFKYQMDKICNMPICVTIFFLFKCPFNTIMWAVPLHFLSNSHPRHTQFMKLMELECWWEWTNSEKKRCKVVGTGRVEGMVKVRECFVTGILSVFWFSILVEFGGLSLFLRCFFYLHTRSAGNAVDRFSFVMISTYLWEYVIYVLLSFGYGKRRMKGWCRCCSGFIGVEFVS